MYCLGVLSVSCALWIDSPRLIGPIVQTADLFHALGTAIAPQIVEPFLTGQKNSTIVTPTDSPPGHTTIATSELLGVSEEQQLAFVSGVQPVQVYALLDLKAAGKSKLGLVFRIDHLKTIGLHSSDTCT
jgi:hypothetical protein